MLLTNFTSVLITCYSVWVNPRMISNLIVKERTITDIYQKTNSEVEGRINYCSSRSDFQHIDNSDVRLLAFICESTTALFTINIDNNASDDICMYSTSDNRDGCFCLNIDLYK
eukprot:Awhi_evm1s10729